MLILIGVILDYNLSMDFRKKDYKLVQNQGLSSIKGKNDYTEELVLYKAGQAKKLKDAIVSMENLPKEEIILDGETISKTL